MERARDKNHESLQLSAHPQRTGGPFSNFPLVGKTLLILIPGLNATVIPWLSKHLQITNHMPSTVPNPHLPDLTVQCRRAQKNAQGGESRALGKGPQWGLGWGWAGSESKKRWCSR